MSPRSVDLDEGPRMMSNVEDCPLNEVQIGMRLVAKFRTESDDVTIPVFRPAD